MGEKLKFLSTLPARGATPPPRSGRSANGISIHAPREGSDGTRRFRRPASIPFLSTLPARGATPNANNTVCFQSFLSTLPARGATKRYKGTTYEQVLFLSTLPARGATLELEVYVDIISISIHAPREGSDAVGAQMLLLMVISIHAPREGSDWMAASVSPARSPFLSTLPARGATGWRRRSPPPGRHFYPRSPRGERHRPDRWQDRVPDFYPRSPRGERPRRSRPRRCRGYFYPRSPRGERQRRAGPNLHLVHFYPRSPRGERPPVRSGLRPAV